MEEGGVSFCCCDVLLLICGDCFINNWYLVRRCLLIYAKSELFLLRVLKMLPDRSARRTCLPTRSPLNRLHAAPTVSPTAGPSGRVSQFTSCRNPISIARYSAEKLEEQRCGVLRRQLCPPSSAPSPPHRPHVQPSLHRSAHGIAEGNVLQNPCVLTQCEIALPHTPASSKHGGVPEYEFSYRPCSWSRRS